MWEEPCISGKNGSGAVFFSGCTLRCIFCQNYEISAENRGRIITSEKLAEEFKRLEDSGVHNISLISPTPYVPAIIKALNIYRPKIPIVYNCGGFERVETLRALEGYIDVYLPDLKYSSDELALLYSGADNYTETAVKAIAEMLRQTGEASFNDDGMILRGTIIRHLILPNHTRNSLDVLELINERLKGAMVSLMGQYVPHGKAELYPKLGRKITAREYEKVKNRLFELDIDGFVQELSSADEKYIPEWDYEQNA